MKTPKPKGAAKPRSTKPKPLTAEQLAAQATFADGAPPALGGAWVRQTDGSLVRDGDAEQHIPEGEKTAPEQPPAVIPPPPPGPETAGVTTDDEQEA